MIGWGPLVLRLVKYLPYIIGAVLIISAVWWLYDSIYESGRADERAVWEAKGLKEQKQVVDILSKRVAELKARTEIDQKNLIKVTENARKMREKLERDITDLSNERMYITAKKRKCESDRNRLPETGDTGGDGSGTERVELSRESEADIRGLIRDAQENTNMYLALVDRLKRADGNGCIEITEND